MHSISVHHAEATDDLPFSIPSKCIGKSDDSWAMQTLLMEDMPPDELHQLLHANDLLNAALQRWQALLALGVDDLADPSGKPLYQAPDQLVSNEDSKIFLLNFGMAGACCTCIIMHKRLESHVDGAWMEALAMSSMPVLVMHLPCLRKHGYSSSNKALPYDDAHHPNRCCCSSCCCCWSDLGM